jgi:hypothetical protein
MIVVDFSDIEEKSTTIMPVASPRPAAAEPGRRQG